VAIGLYRFQAPDFEPLAGEVVEQGARLRVAEHALHLRAEQLRLVERAFSRGAHQFVIRHAAPEEIRKTRGQFVAADPVRLRTGVCVLLDAEQEVGRNEDGLQSYGDASLERCAPLASAVRNRNVAIEFLRSGGPAKCPCRQVGENLTRARSIMLPVLMSADENLTQALGGWFLRVAVRACDIELGYRQAFPCGMRELLLRPQICQSPFFDLSRAIIGRSAGEEFLRIARRRFR